jgi:hypothetical protein
MQSRAFACLFLALAVTPAMAAGERVCEQSESTVVASPKARWAASVQHQVCETSTGGVAAAVTVFVGEAAAPLQGERVVATAVPRSREEWPRAHWRSETLLEIWVPNLANVLEVKPAFGAVQVALRYCGDDPEQRARVARYPQDLKRWQEEVSRWAELRQKDPEGAGPRPQRPAEPRETARPCRDSEINPGQ